MTTGATSPTATPTATPDATPNSAPGSKWPSRAVPTTLTAVDWTPVVNALRAAASTITAIAGQVVSGNVPGAASSLAALTRTAAWEALVAPVKALGFKTVGVVAGGEGSLIVGGQGMVGILTGTDDTSLYYFYKNMGISVGVQEGVALTAGLYLHNEEPKDDWAIELFSGLGGALVEGVSIEVFTTAGTGSGALLLLETGEEIKVNFGACVASWSAINGKPALRIDTTLYVVDGGAHPTGSEPSTVTPVSTRTNQPGPAVSLTFQGYQLGDITPDGGTLYAMQQPPQTTMVPISLDLVMPQVGNPFSVRLPNIPSAEQPVAFAVSPDDEESGWLLPMGEAWLIPLSLGNNQPGAPISLPGAGWAMAITPDGTTAYIASPAGVVPVNLEKRTAGAMIAVSPAYKVVISPGGNTVYVSTQYQGTYTITPIAVATNTPGPPIPMQSVVQSMVITPDGGTMYVATEAGVLPLNLDTKTFGPAIAVGVGRRYTALAMTPGGQTCYALYQTFDPVTNPNAGSELVPISTDSNRPLPPILLANVKNPTGMGIAL